MRDTPHKLLKFFAFLIIFNIIASIGLTTVVLGAEDDPVSFPEDPQPESYTIFGTKFEDLNNNLMAGAEDAKLSNWNIRLYSEQWNFIWEETSAQDGTYSFSELTQGTYFLCEVNQVGWTQVYPNAQNQGVLNNSQNSEEGEYCLQVVINTDSPLSVLSKDFVNHRTTTNSTINVKKKLIDLNGWETVSPYLFPVYLYSNGNRLDVQNQYIGNDLTPTYAKYTVQPGTYQIIETGASGFANLGCIAEGDNDTVFDVAAGENIWVTCTNEMIDFIPSVSIHSSPSNNVIDPADIILTANGQGGNGQLSYLWNCDNGETSTTSTILLTSVGKHVCKVVVTDADGDIANTSGTYSINLKPEVIVKAAVTGTQLQNNQPSTSENIDTIGGSIDEGINTEEDILEENVLGTEAQICNVKSSTSGYVFIDGNRNNLKDNTEEGVSNIDLTFLLNVIDNNGEASEIEVGTVKTNTLGRWEKAFCPGSYKISIDKGDLPDSTSVSGEDTFTFTINEGMDRENINFAINQIQASGNTNWWLFLIPLVILVLAAGGYAIYSTNQKRKSVG